MGTLGTDSILLTFSSGLKNQIINWKYDKQLDVTGLFWSFERANCSWNKKTRSLPDNNVKHH